MQKKMQKLVVFVAACWFSTSALTAPLYSFTDLGTANRFSSYAYAINNSGQVAGELSNGEGFYDPFFYSGGVMTNLDPLVGAFGGAYGINDGGIVAGWALTPNYYQAFSYHNGTVSYFGTSNSYMEARGVNNSGQIAGWMAGTDQVLLYSGGAMTDLGLGYAYGINDSGQIVGQASNHAALFSGGAVTDLGTLGGNSSQANAINNLGQIVGRSSTTGNAAPHAFLYSGGAMTELGTLGLGSEAFAINIHGQIVGASYGINSAFLYANGAMQDLNALIDPALGWHLTEAHGINDLGQIVGWAYHGRNVYPHAFLLTPVPEPSSFVLAAFGFAGLLFRALHRRKNT